MSQWTQHRACEACPYRKDTPTGIWDAAEYRKLMARDAQEQCMTTYGCHLNSARPKDEAQPCAGWLADQKRRGVPNIGLRMALISNPSAGPVFEKVNEDDPNLYGTIAEMVRANVGKRFPNRAPKAKRLVAKLNRGNRA